MRARATGKWGRRLDGWLRRRRSTAANEVLGGGICLLVGLAIVLIGLLDEAGYPDPDGPGPAKRFTITCGFGPSPSRSRMAPTRPLAWRRLGTVISLTM
mgnify:CR=1 FL=1